MDHKISIELKDISKTFTIKDRTNNSIFKKLRDFFISNSMRKIYALKDINLCIKQGEVFGIIGKNGSGKSTLLKIISGVYSFDKGGSRVVNGRLIRLSLGIGFDGELTAKENIYLNASLLGITFRKIGVLLNEIIDFAEINSFTDTKVKYFSTGMRMRLAFSIAINVDADIFLFDEFFGGVGDEKFKKKSDEIFKKKFLHNKTVVIVSHSLSQISNYCDRAMLIDKGRSVIVSNPEEVIQRYRDIINNN